MQLTKQLLNCSSRASKSIDYSCMQQLVISIRTIILLQTISYMYLATTILATYVAIQIPKPIYIQIPTVANSSYNQLRILYDSYHIAINCMASGSQLYNPYQIPIRLTTISYKNHDVRFDLHTATTCKLVTYSSYCIIQLAISPQIYSQLKLGNYGSR